MFVQVGIVSGPDPDAFAAAASHVAVFEVRPRSPARLKKRPASCEFSASGPFLFVSPNTGGASAVASAAAVGVGGKGGVAGDRRVHGGAGKTAEVLLEHGASARAFEGVFHAGEAVVPADLDGRPVAWSVVPVLTVTPGVAASTLYIAERRAGLSSGFHSQSVASWKTRLSAVSSVTPSITSPTAGPPWLTSRARSFAGLVGQAANSARVGDQCVATGNSLGTLAPGTLEPCW